MPPRRSPPRRAPPRRSSPQPAPPRAPSRAPARQHDSVTVEVGVAPGLDDVVLRELRTLARRERLPTPLTSSRDDAISVAWPGDPAALHALRTAQSVARVWRFDVPRPKALLDTSALRTLGAGLRGISGGARFRALRLAAAGAGSPVMQRLARALGDEVGLPVDADDGDLLVRVRPGAEGGWEVLARTTPRPLSVRPWRVCDRPGALDAALAAALVQLAGVRAGDRVANPMVGSGTLLIERALAGAAACLHGVDSDLEALACAARNAEAAGVSERLWLARGDARSTLRPDDAAEGRYDLVLVDPPWGDAVGDHAGNAALYGDLLAAAAAQTVRGGRLVLVTHEVRLAERLLGEQRWWAPQHARRVWQGGHRPLCVILERLPGGV